MSGVRDMLIAQEGVRCFPYRDSRGRLTIGVGRCLETKGLSRDEALYLLDRDIQDARLQAASFAWWDKLDAVRKDVVVMMIFNLGGLGFRGFKKMIAAITRGDFQTASDEMLASTWREQVGTRAKTLSEMMRSGTYPQE